MFSILYHRSHPPTSACFDLYLSRRFKQSLRGADACAVTEADRVCVAWSGASASTYAYILNQ